MALIICKDFLSVMCKFLLHYKKLAKLHIDIQVCIIASVDDDVWWASQEETIDV